jgi:hypothetical protein
VGNVVRLIAFTAAGIWILGACSSGPVRSFSAGDELARFDFSEPATFEEGAYADATLRIVDGVYRITVNEGDNEVWWSQWGDSMDNVVIDVVAEQTSEAVENAYGVACRLRGHVGQELPVDPTLAAIVSGEAAEPTEVVTDDTAEETTEDEAEEAVTEAATEEATEAATEEMTEEATEDATSEATERATSEDEATSEATAEPTPELANGDGYLFLIQGSGSFAILRARGRDITPLVNWTASSLIHQGAARNELRAVCMGDYLALYINGEFAGEATDSTYTSGQIGLAASAASRLGVQVEFDDLVVRQAVSG